MVSKINCVQSGTSFEKVLNCPAKAGKCTKGYLTATCLICARTATRDRRQAAGAASVTEGSRMFLILLLNNSFQGLHQETSFILNQAQRVCVYLEQDLAQAGYSC